MTSRERKYRIKLIQEHHYGKDMQYEMDSVIRNHPGMTYYELYHIMKIPLGFGRLAIAIKNVTKAWQSVFKLILEAVTRLDEVYRREIKEREMKRTLENCSHIKKMGAPGQSNGKCLGFCVSVTNDEPLETCKKCSLREDYEDE